MALVVRLGMLAAVIAILASWYVRLGPVESLQLLKDMEYFIGTLVELGVLQLEDDKPTQQMKDAIYYLRAVIREHGIEWKEIRPLHFEITSPATELQRELIERYRPACVQIDYAPARREPRTIDFREIESGVGFSEITIVTSDRSLAEQVNGYSDFEFDNPVDAFGRKWHLRRFSDNLHTVTGTFEATLFELREIKLEPSPPPPPARCEPPPEHQDKRWHWLRNKTVEDVAYWSPLHGWTFNCHTDAVDAVTANAVGWSYIAPCLPPVTMRMDASGAAVVEPLPEGRL